MDTRRRILTIAAIAILLLGLVIGLYFWWEGHQATLTVGSTPVQNPFGTGGTPVNNGSNGSSTTGSTGTGNTSTQSAVTQVTPRLVKITAGPVAEGQGMVEVMVPSIPSINSGSASSTASSTVPDTEVRYVERESGNIYSYDIHSNTLTRISNRTVPGAIEASWLGNGAMTYLRFITTDNGGQSHADSYALPANGVGGYALPEDLQEVMAVGSSSLLTLNSTDTGSIATLSGPNGEAAKTLFSTPLTQIKTFSTQGSSFVESLPSAKMDGYAFAVDGSGFHTIIGPLKGLSILPDHAGDKVLYSYIENGTLHLSFFDMSSHTSTSLPIPTLADKCVWASDDSGAYCGVPVSIPSGTLPDDWYQGAASFSDRIWHIDFGSRVAQIVIDLPTAASTNIDVTALAVDPTQDAISFVNRNDGSLWSYDL